MKTKTLMSIFTLGLIIFSIISCKSQSYSLDEQVLSMLKDFYTSYITESAKMPPSVSKVNSLKEKYCTAKLLQKIAREEFDYDPFLKAQDCNIEWLKTLAVKKDTTGSNQYCISYTDTYNNTQIVIKLVVAKEKDLYKIDSIF